MHRRMGATKWNYGTVRFQHSHKLVSVSGQAALERRLLSALHTTVTSTPPPETRADKSLVQSPSTLEARKARVWPRCSSSASSVSRRRSLLPRLVLSSADLGESWRLRNAIEEGDEGRVASSSKFGAESSEATVVGENQGTGSGIGWSLAGGTALVHERHTSVVRHIGTRPSRR